MTWRWQVLVVVRWWRRWRHMPPCGRRGGRCSMPAPISPSPNVRSETIPTFHASLPFSSYFSHTTHAILFQSDLPFPRILHRTAGAAGIFADPVAAFARATRLLHWLELAHATALLLAPHVAPLCGTVAFITHILSAQVACARVYLCLFVCVCVCICVCVCVCVCVSVVSVTFLCEIVTYTFHCSFVCLFTCVLVVRHCAVIHTTRSDTAALCVARGTR